MPATVSSSGGPSFNRNLSNCNKYFEKLNPYYPLQDGSDDTLIFESRFESGNLKRAI